MAFPCNFESHCEIETILYLQTSMNALKELTTVMEMLHAKTLRAALSVLATQASLVMGQWETAMVCGGYALSS